jgi:hypothetical protein
VYEVSCVMSLANVFRTSNDCKQKWVFPLLADNSTGMQVRQVLFISVEHHT